MVAASASRVPAPSEILKLYRRVRQDSRSLGRPLSDADATVQSMPDASPAKWHLAHTTWFFEAMVLGPNVPGYRPFDESFNYLFNSYYETIGERHPRPRRGMITRPHLDTIFAFREHVDEAVERLLQSAPSPEVAELVELGCHHEQQHQELLLTDILHLFSQSPIKPAYKDPAAAARRRERSRTRSRCRRASRAASSRSAMTATVSTSTARARATARSSSRSASPTGS